MSIMYYQKGGYLRVLRVLYILYSTILHFRFLLMLPVIGFVAGPGSVVAVAVIIVVLLWLLK